MTEWFYAVVWRWVPGWELETQWPAFTEKTWPPGLGYPRFDPSFGNMGPPYKVFQLYKWDDRRGWTVTHEETNW